MAGKGLLVSGTKVVKKFWMHQRVGYLFCLCCSLTDLMPWYIIMYYNWSSRRLLNFCTQLYLFIHLSIFPTSVVDCFLSRSPVNKMALVINFSPTQVWTIVEERRTKKTNSAKTQTFLTYINKRKRETSSKFQRWMDRYDYDQILPFSVWQPPQHGILGECWIRCDGLQTYLDRAQSL